MTQPNPVLTSHVELIMSQLAYVMRLLPSSPDDVIEHDRLGRWMGVLNGWN